MSSDPPGTNENVLGTDALFVAPRRRQTFTLSGTDGTRSDSRSVTTVTRGLDLVAGSPSGASGVVDGQGALARFNVPTLGAVDAAGNLFICDSSGETIRKIDPSGNVTTIAGVSGHAGYLDGPASTALFNYPTGLAVDAQGDVYVSEVFNNTIRKISNGVVSTVAGSAGHPGSSDGQGTQAHFYNPNAMVFDSHGNLFVTDTLNHDVRKIDSLGNVTTWAGTAGGTGDADGQGTAARFDQPNGLTIDAADNLYVSDVYRNTIRKIDPAGNVTTVAGTPGVSGASDGPAHSASFNYPACIAIDPTGTLYVADTNNYTVRKIDPSGQVTTVAGMAGHPGVATGALPGQLGNIYGLTVSPAGDLYVLSENRILQVTAP